MQENARERAKKSESRAMEREDPMRRSTDFSEIGSHLAPMSRVEALYRVESNFSPEGDGDEDILRRAVLLRPEIKSTITEYTSPTQLAL